MQNSGPGLIGLKDYRISPLLVFKPQAWGGAIIPPNFLWNNILISPTTKIVPVVGEIKEYLRISANKRRVHDFKFLDGWNTNNGANAKRILRSNNPINPGREFPRLTSD